MDYHTIPKIKIEVESMRHSIISMLDDRHTDLLKVVDAGIDAAIIELPPRLAKLAKEMSEDIMQEAMQKALNEYWNSGDGRDQIDTMIAKKFKGAIR